MIDDFSFNLDDALMHKTQAIIPKMIQMHILSIPWIYVKSHTVPRQTTQWNNARRTDFLLK